MKRKVQSTIWLDVLTYILLPAVIFVTILNIIGTFSNNAWSFYVVLMLLVDIAFVIFYGYTVYETHKRNKIALKLLRILFWITSIETSLDFANTKYMNEGYNIFLMFGIYFALCYAVWIRTNEIYLEKRKDLFDRESILKTTYRCTECKRLVPKGKDCPHCGKKIDSKLTD